MAHEVCGSVTKLKYITQQLRRQLGREREIVLGMHRREEDIIKKLRETRKADIEKYRFAFLGKELSLLAHQIYFTKLEGDLSAATAKQLVAKIDQIRGGSEDP
jgi:hypothetical protein